MNPSDPQNPIPPQPTTVAEPQKVDVPRYAFLLRGLTQYLAIGFIGVPMAVMMLAFNDTGSDGVTAVGLTLLGSFAVTPLLLGLTLSYAWHKNSTIQQLKHASVTSYVLVAAGLVLGLTSYGLFTFEGSSGQVTLPIMSVLLSFVLPLAIATVVLSIMSLHKLGTTFWSVRRGTRKLTAHDYKRRMKIDAILLVAAFCVGMLFGGSRQEKNAVYTVSADVAGIVLIVLLVHAIKYFSAKRTEGKTPAA